ncbi:MAG: hypothetical protein HUU57_03475 [Bdellovibrio sp.]|nr:hypothetical protein [Bdellovibrio sp.]
MVREMTLFKTLTITLVICLGSVGCSMDASIDTLQSAIDEVLQTKMSNKEILPASNQNVVTTDGYFVQSSVNFHSGGKKTTTLDGYRAESGVQSTLFKKE